MNIELLTAATWESPRPRPCRSTAYRGVSILLAMPEGVTTKQEVLQRLRRHRAELRSLGVSRLGLFGSFARGEPSPDSDVGLLVDFEPGEKTFDHFMDLAERLEEILERRVVLLTRESLSPYLGPRILREVEDVRLRP